MLGKCAKGLIALLAASLVPAAFGSSLQDWEFNVNGTDYFPAGGATLGSVPGLVSSSFNSTTGLGTLTLTYNPGKAGTYYLGAWFFDPVGKPFYNEYGVVNGTPTAGQTWQIDIPEYDATSANHGTGTILDNLAAGTLNNTNTVPGQTNNYLDDCGANSGGAANASCNDLVSMAEGFKFTLTAKQEVILTLVLGSSNPGGFSLEDVHPVDGSNTSASDVFFSGAAVIQSTVTSGVPEPASWALLAMAVGILVLGKLGRSHKTSHS